MTTQKLILKLYFIGHMAKEKGLIVLGQLQMIDVLTPGIDGRRFWPTTFRACMVGGVKGTYTGLQPCVAGKSDLEVSETLRRH